MSRKKCIAFYLLCACLVICPRTFLSHHQFSSRASIKISRRGTFLDSGKKQFKVQPEPPQVVSSWPSLSQSKSVSSYPPPFGSFNSLLPSSSALCHGNKEPAKSNSCMCVFQLNHSYHFKIIQGSRIKLSLTTKPKNIIKNYVHTCLPKICHKSM